MDVPAASLAQVTRGRDGKFIEIQDDVCSIAKQLQEIDPHIRVRWSDAGEYFVIYWHELDGSGKETENLILTTTELDGRVVERVRELGSPDYDYGAELDRQDQEAEKARMDAVFEKYEEKAERTHHALRRVFGHQDRVFIDKDIPKGNE